MEFIFCLSDYFLSTAIKCIFFKFNYDLIEPKFELKD